MTRDEDSIKVKAKMLKNIHKDMGTLRDGIPTAQERQLAKDLDSNIQVVLEPRSQIETEIVDGRPVIPLQETMAFANEYYATFESALDMLGRMYDVDTDATYCLD